MCSYAKISLRGLSRYLSNLTSIYTISREDMYDFQRCPKIVAIKAYNALRAIRKETSAESTKQPRAVEPAIIGSIGEAAVRLGFAGVPVSTAIQQIAVKIPQIKVSGYLRRIATESLAGVTLTVTKPSGSSETCNFNVESFVSKLLTGDMIGRWMLAVFATPGTTESVSAIAYLDVATSVYDVSISIVGLPP